MIYGLLQRQPPSSLFMHISWFCNFNIREAVLNFELFRTLEKSEYFEFNNTIYKKKTKIAKSYSSEFKPLQEVYNHCYLFPLVSANRQFCSRRTNLIYRNRQNPASSSVIVPYREIP